MSGIDIRDALKVSRVLALPQVKVFCRVSWEPSPLWGLRKISLLSKAEASFRMERARVRSTSRSSSKAARVGRELRGCSVKNDTAFNCSQLGFCHVNL